MTFAFPSPLALPRLQLPTLYSRLSSSSSHTPTSTSTREREREILDLDRSTSSEFRSLLTLDVRTTLRGFPGLVGEVLPLPIGTGAGTGAGAGVGAGVDEKKKKIEVQGGKAGEGTEQERGVVVAWTIC